MRKLIIAFLFLPFISYSQSSLVKQIDQTISSYNKIKNSQLIILANTNDKYLNKDFGLIYKFRKSDKKLLSIIAFFKKEPTNPVYEYYYANDYLIKVTLQSPRNNFRNYYYNHSKFVYTNDSTSNGSTVLLRQEATMRDRAYNYLNKNSVQ